VNAATEDGGRPRAVLLTTHPGPTPRQRLLLAALSDLGCRTLTIGWDRSRSDPSPRRERDDLLTVGTRAPLGRPSLLLHHVLYRRALVRALRDLVRAGDPPRLVVAGHLLHLPLASRFPDAVWIYDCAEFYTETLAEYLGPLRTMGRPLLRAWERRLLRPVAGVLAVDSEAGWLERRLAASGRSVLVVPNYPSRADDPPEFPSPFLHGAGVLAYAGGIQEDKGLSVMLESLRRLRLRRPVRLLLVGPIAGSSDALRARVASLGLAEAVEVHPPLPYPELVAFLAARADVGLVPYQPRLLTYGYGARNARKLFTYLQAGLAVLVPESREIARPVLETEAGLAVRTDDPEAVAEALDVLLGDAEALVRRRRRAREAFLERYNWEGFAPTLDGWLRTMLDLRSGDGRPLHAEARRRG
jgi:glycosyltransferase involved in cell wall biosynthesis